MMGDSESVIRSWNNAGMCFRLCKCQHQEIKQVSEQGEPCSGEHAHKLLERFKRLTRIELDIHVFDVDEICGEGSKMVGIIPLPRRSLVFCKNTLWQRRIIRVQLTPW